MQPQDFNMLDDEELVWSCAQPIVQKMRGKSPAIKYHVFTQINSAQRALFLFQVLYGHANAGMLPFFGQIAYLADSFDIWSSLKAGMAYFGDAEMLRLIEKMEIAYHEAMEQREYTNPLEELETRYAQRIPITLKQIASHIRNHPEEFTAPVDS